MKVEKWGREDTVVGSAHASTIQEKGSYTLMTLTILSLHDNPGFGDLVTRALATPTVSGFTITSLMIP